MAKGIRSNEERVIEEAVQLLDELRMDFDMALTNDNAELALTLLEEIKLAAASLDERAGDRSAGEPAPEASARVVQLHTWQKA